MRGPEGQLRGWEMELPKGRIMCRGTRVFGLRTHFAGSWEWIWGKQKGKETCLVFGGRVRIQRWAGYEAETLAGRRYRGHVWWWPAEWTRWRANSWKTAAQGSLEDWEAGEGTSPPPQDSCLVWGTPVPFLLHSSLSPVNERMTEKVLSMVPAHDQNLVHILEKAK